MALRGAAIFALVSSLGVAVGCSLALPGELDRVPDVAQRNPAGATNTVAPGQQRSHHQPFRVGQIA